LELLVTFEVVVSFAPTPVLIALLGGMRTPEDGVYFTGVVSAFEPAADEPVEANDEVAPGLQNHVVLIQLRVQGIDLALAERIVQRIVEG
jgi:hypothetical protein